jgi:hypothetical protein
VVNSTLQKSTHAAATSGVQPASAAAARDHSRGTFSRDAKLSFELEH